ncbi:tetratricopeptide repeat protein [bacterium]|nr:tetratricopeptide repeat protein [bacterium]
MAMAQPTSQETVKSVLDLALELGVRTDTVLQAMQQLGYGSALPTDPLEPGLEQSLVDRLVDDGVISTSLQNGKGRRKRTGQPIANDDIVTEALGASETGFKESQIPRQITFETSFAEKPSLFQRWFGKKQNLVGSLKERNLSAEEINELFSPPGTQSNTDAFSGEDSQEPQEDSPPQPDTTTGTQPPTPQREDTAPAETERKTESNSTNEIGIDEEILSDMEGVDLDAQDEIEGIDADDLEDFDALEDISGMDEGDMSFAEEDEQKEEESHPGEREEEESLDEKREEGEQEEQKEKKKQKQKPLHPLVNKIVSRINLSPTEVWTLMGGCVVIMLSVVGVGIYGWLHLDTSSPKTRFEQAVTHKSNAITYMSDNNWAAGIEEYENAAYDFAFVKEDQGNEKRAEAFDEWCDTLYQLAGEYREQAETHTDEDWQQQSELFHKRMVDAYQEYKNYLNDKVQSSMGMPTAESSPHLEKSQNADLRIAVGYRYLGEYQKAVDQVDFLVDNSNANIAEKALLNQAETYFEWAASRRQTFLHTLSADSELNQNNNNPLRDNPDELYKRIGNLYQKSINKYQQALDRQAPVSQPPSQEWHSDRMRIFAKMGETEKQFYQLGESFTDAHGDNRFSVWNASRQNELLNEAIGYYQKAREEAQAAEKNIERTNLADLEVLKNKRLDIIKQVADLYLIQGENMANRWAELERSAAFYPKELPIKQTLNEGIEEAKLDTQRILGNAKPLYFELLSEADSLSEGIPQEILYNHAKAEFLLRNYNEAISAGDWIDSTTYTKMAIPETMKAKVRYLQGDAAWELSQTTNNYTKVKQYYYKALKRAPMFPSVDNPALSHRADIRLTRAFYMVEQEYDQAAVRFESMNERYEGKNKKKSPYAYLTLYWHAKALEKRGDSLVPPNASLSSNSFFVAASTEDQEEPSTTVMNGIHAYSHAFQQYNQAITVRDDSQVMDKKHETYLKDILFNRGHCAFKVGLLSQRKPALYNKLLNHAKFSVLAEPFQQAKVALASALEKYPPENDYIAQNYIPNALERLGDAHVYSASYEEAIDYYQTYLAYNYENTDARVTRKMAEAYSKQGLYDKARELYNRVIDRYPPPSDKAVARALRQGKQVGKGPGFQAMKKVAESHYREAEVREAEDFVTSLEEALDAYQLITDKYPLDAEHRDIPSDPECQRMIGSIHYQLANYNEAVRNYRQYVSQAQDDPQIGRILFKIGKALHKLHTNNQNPSDSKGKRSYLEEAIETLSSMNPDIMEDQNLFAKAMVELGNVYLAKAQYYPEIEKTKVELNDSPMTEQQVNELLLKIQAYTNARQAFSRAVSFFHGPEDGYINDQIVDTKEKIKTFGHKIDNFQELIRANAEVLSMSG